MNFTTKISIQKSNSPIDYYSKTMLLGSCFSENIGEKFQYFKFETSVNPFGIIFNPVSLAKIVERSLKQHYYKGNDIFFHNELWHCFEVHSELSNPNMETFINSLNELLDSTKKQLHDSTHIIITLGTSWVYRNIESDKIVANCHKVPQKLFKKELLSINQIEESLQHIMGLVQSVNPNCKFIFTVSPVRHIKDGFIENTQSKAHLITAIHSNNQQPTTNNYFPSYEIMMDELRDYRFYTEDMLHPNQIAINYIWEKFQEVWISENAIKTMREVDAVQKGLQHKPFNLNSESHQEFLQKLEIEKAALKSMFPHISF
jgi:GSCFA family